MQPFIPNCAPSFAAFVSQDSMEANALLVQITNFGQTPCQLFKRKHPKRAPLLPSTLPLLLHPRSALRLTMSGSPSGGQSAAPLVHISVQDGRVLAAASDRTFQAHYWVTPSSSASGTFTFTSSASSPGLPYAIEPDSHSPRRVAAPFAVRRGGRSAIAYPISARGWSKDTEIAGMRARRGFCRNSSYLPDFMVPTIFPNCQCKESK